MTWELEKFVTDIVNSKSVQTVFGHPIYSALIIVSMVLLIIYFTFRHDVILDEDSNNSMIGLMFTAGIYSIITVLALVYLQHRSLSKDFERRYSKRAIDDTVSATIGRGLDVFEPVPLLLDGDEEESYYAQSYSESSSKSSKKSRKKKQLKRK